MEQQFSSLDRVMEPETISKNGASPKSQMSRVKKVKKVILNVLVGMLMVVVFTTCSGGGGVSPSSITNQWFSAIAKQDYKMAAKYSYADIKYTDEEKAEILKRSIKNAIVKYEIQDEQISADGENATVTVLLTVKSLFAQAASGNMLSLSLKGEMTEKFKIKLIKKRDEGWKIDLESTINGNTFYYIMDGDNVKILN